MSARPINDGGLVTPCALCAEPSVRNNGRQRLCAKHYRYRQMRSRARLDGKAVPTMEQLDNLYSWDGLTCRDCKRSMNWLRDDGADTQLTLQHYRSGSMGLVCLSCNARHASMPGDTYCSMPKDHKRCPQCASVKPHADFARDNGRSGPMRLKSWCKSCSSAAHTEWQRGNREHYNLTQREGRARRKLAERAKAGAK